MCSDTHFRSEDTGLAYLGFSSCLLVESMNSSPDSCRVSDIRFSDVTGGGNVQLYTTESVVLTWFVECSMVLAVVA